MIYSKFAQWFTQNLHKMIIFWSVMWKRFKNIYWSIGAKLYHYRENDAGVEVDAIIELCDGEYGAVIKRPDGIYVLPITSLKP